MKIIYSYEGGRDEGLESSVLRDVGERFGEARATGSHSGEDNGTSLDLESGLHAILGPERLRQNKSALAAQSCEGSSGLTGLLQSMNVAIEWAANKLAKATYDHVEKPEEGLLLPIQSEERGEELTSAWITERRRRTDSNAYQENRNV